MLPLRRAAALLILVFAAIGTASVISAVTAGNTVPPSRLGIAQSVVTSSQLAPSECRIFRLMSTLIAAPAGATQATGLGVLVLGGPGTQQITGTNHNDCIFGGSGGDTIDGGKGADACLSYGPATFINCEFTYVLQPGSLAY